MIHILVVEDETRVADLLKKGLEESGYNVSVAYDGAMGLRLFKSAVYDFVISDVILPNMNGFEFCKEVRAINKE
ncbi:MAG TPA: DNA-binding response regulator, partial [Porphyromonadaceae bacterium]|nr:DNA-binding response regulator [Porphyromonadaceae bacterium]